MELKKEVQEELLTLVDDLIVSEIALSEGHLTVAEMAREVIFNAPKEIL